METKVGVGGSEPQPRLPDSLCTRCVMLGFRFSRHKRPSVDHPSNRRVHSFCCLFIDRQSQACLPRSPSSRPVNLTFHSSGLGLPTGCWGMWVGGGGAGDGKGHPQPLSLKASLSPPSIKGPKTGFATQILRVAVCQGLVGAEQHLFLVSYLCPLLGRWGVGR